MTKVKWFFFSMNRSDFHLTNTLSLFGSSTVLSLMEQNIIFPSLKFLGLNVCQDFIYATHICFFWVASPASKLSFSELLQGRVPFGTFHLWKHPGQSVDNKGTKYCQPPRGWTWRVISSSWSLEEEDSSGPVWQQLCESTEATSQPGLDSTPTTTQSNNVF